MAFITLDREKLRFNFEYLNNVFKHDEIEWAIVTKVLCGNKLYLKEVLNLGIKQLCDSRVSNIRRIKELSDDVETIYIKPPPHGFIPQIIEYADISFNTELKTLKLLSKEAQKQSKRHKIVIMVELGELREGVMRDELLNFYEAIFELPNIEVIGIGTNLSCLYGVLPNHDKLIQLILYKELIAAKFDRNIKYVSGGSSVSISLLNNGTLPKGINHFRIGETLFLGTDVYNDTLLDGMHNDIMILYAEIIELTEKPIVPDGTMGTNVEGHSFNLPDQLDGSKTTIRAILDVGLLDIDSSHIIPTKNEIGILGSSSDMLVVDLGDNPFEYKTGDLISFRLDYVSLLRVMNSKYIEKKVI